MGPMVRGEKLDKRRLTKLAAVGIIAMFTWSLIAAPASEGQDESVAEPEEISSYFTFADAAPIAGYVDHQALPAPAFGPGFAHTSTTVELPSEASAIAWLLDAGIANGLHGTTTGASVPTEVNAKQPGGEEKGEFTTAGGPVGEEEFGRVAAGVARVSAVHSAAPRGFGTAYFSDVCLFPAAGSPPEPPGTYDPDARFPGGAKQSPVPDPGPISRQCIVSAASIASTSQSIRENDTVTSISVAEISGITIGDRTSDNRCTNCFYIDAMRVEAFAQANGQPGGSKAGYRLMFGRACRRAFVPWTTDTAREALPPPIGAEAPEAHEEDQCLGNPSREGFPEGNADAGADVLSEVPAEDLNAFFDEPLILGMVPCPGTPGKNCRLAIRVNAGERNIDPARAEHTTNPPEDVCRNYAYPDPNPKAKEDPDCKKYGVRTGVDKDQGQEAKAVAEGLDIDILTLTASQVIPPNEDLETCLEGRIPAALYDNEQFGTLYGAVKDQVGCPIAGLRSIRELNLTFGVAQAGAVARPGFLPSEGGGDGGGLGGIIPPITPPIGPGTDIGGGAGGGGVQVIGGGGLGSGKYGLKIDWKSLKIKPWPAKDLAKALFAGAIIAGMVLLIRRRLRHA